MSDWPIFADKLPILSPSPLAGSRLQARGHCSAAMVAVFAAVTLGVPCQVSRYVLAASRPSTPRHASRHNLLQFLPHTRQVACRRFSRSVLPQSLTCRLSGERQSRAAVWCARRGQYWRKRTRCSMRLVLAKRLANDVPPGCPGPPPPPSLPQPASQPLSTRPARPATLITNAATSTWG